MDRIVGPQSARQRAGGGEQITATDVDERDAVYIRKTREDVSIDAYARTTGRQPRQPARETRGGARPPGSSFYYDAYLGQLGDGFAR